MESSVQISEKDLGALLTWYERIMVPISNPREENAESFKSEAQMQWRLQEAADGRNMEHSLRNEYLGLWMEQEQVRACVL